MTLLLGISFTSLWKSKIRVYYDESSYKVIERLRELRSMWMTNYFHEQAASSWTYKIPEFWYWLELVDLWTWSVNLKLFYNEDDDVSFSTWDVVIQDRVSNDYSLFVESIYWSGSELPYPPWNSTWDLIFWSWTKTWTIIFRNNTWEFPDDWSVFISSWTWSNNLRDITFQFHMRLDWWFEKKRRINFDRITKTIKTESCRDSSDTSLESCWWWSLRWVEWF